MSFDMVIKLISNVAIVLVLSPCKSTSNVVHSIESSNRISWGLFPMCSQYLSNISASQVEE